MHYVRWYRHGDPLYVRPTSEELFWDKVTVTDDGSCWEWLAYKNDGYGRFGTGKGERLAHRISYQFLVGEIPAGMELDHLCRNRGCVNPAHLEPVVHPENMRRARREWCSRGHRYAPDEIRRDCRICKSMRSRRYYLETGK